MTEENPTEGKYFIEIPHTAGECNKVVKLVHISGWLTHFWWGCKFGTHTGVMIVDAESPEEVRNILPPILREQARIVQLEKIHVKHKEKTEDN